jgi:hypothetical protein
VKGFVSARLMLDYDAGGFVGVVDTGQRWNGWACPRFRRAVAEDIARSVVEPADLSSDRAWRWDGDELVLTRKENIEDAGEERWSPDEDGWYHLGSWAWCWTESTDDNDERRRSVEDEG